MSDLNSPTFESGHVRLVHRNPVILALAASPIVVAAGALFSGARASAQMFAVLAVVLTHWAYRANLRPLQRPVFAHAGPDGITLGGLFIARSRLASALLLLGLTPRVILSRKGWLSVEIVVENLGEGRALMRALGLDARSQPVEFWSLSWVLTSLRYTIPWLVALPLAWFASTAMTSGAEPFLFFFALTWLGLLLTPTRTRVDIDGLSFRWLWVDRRIPHSEIEDVRTYQERHAWNWFESGIVIVLEGADLRIPVSVSYKRFSFESDSQDNMTAMLLWERLRECALAREAVSPKSDRGGANERS